MKNINNLTNLEMDLLVAKVGLIVCIVIISGMKLKILHLEDKVQNKYR